MACTEWFALELAVGETLAWTDRGMDFIIYRLSGPGGKSILYAGNAPQSGGTEIRTGRNFPTVVSVTGTQVEDRIHVRGPLLERCGSAA